MPPIRIVNSALIFQLLLVPTAWGAVTVTEPIPYREASDAASFWRGVSPILQDFESDNGPWEIGFSIDCGIRGSHTIDGAKIVDSVENGEDGASWYCNGSELNVTFDNAVKMAGFAWTDGDPKLESVNVYALDKNLDVMSFENRSSLFGDLADERITGTTDEDRFFGISADAAEIYGIRVAMSSSDSQLQLSGLEIDHVAFAIPEPTMGITSIGLAMLLMRRRARRLRAIVA